MTRSQRQRQQRDLRLLLLRLAQVGECAERDADDQLLLDQLSGDRVCSVLPSRRLRDRLRLCTARVRVDCVCAARFSRRQRPLRLAVLHHPIETVLPVVRHHIGAIAATSALPAERPAVSFPLQLWMGALST